MKIYNSLTREKEEFKPIRPGYAGMYVCGPTVYDEPHIGHARAAYIFEVIKNYLQYKGLKVKFIKNITDIDDKIIAKAKEELAGIEIDKAVVNIARKYTQRYYEDMDMLGISRADEAPLAVQHIRQMIKFISRLIKKGYAYPVDGDVYFDVRKFKNYGRLSHQNTEEMRNAVRIAKDEKKKDALDFALWKKSKPDEPAWDSPWGRGRPGWHIECSVMSTKYLGDEFDIHGGGIDLVFPHHENEIAQSRAVGKAFARIWMHNGLLTISGQKMAKSLGNFITIKDFAARYKDLNYLKLLFLSAHYRSSIDYTEEKIKEVRKRIEGLWINFSQLHNIAASYTAELKDELSKAEIQNAQQEALLLRKKFEEAMDDDFNTPEALVVLSDMVKHYRDICSGYQENKIPVLLRYSVRCGWEILQELEEIFKLSIENYNPQYFVHDEIDKVTRALKKEFSDLPLGGIAEEPAGESMRPDRTEQMNEEMKNIMNIIIAERDKARKTKNFAESDRIRKKLLNIGIILRDSKETTEWLRNI